MEKKKHVHKFKTIKQDTGRKVLKCILGCPTYIIPELAIGREAICWRCDGLFILDEISVHLKKPHCKDCTRSKRKEILAKAARAPSKIDQKKIEASNRAKAQLDSLMGDLLKNGE